MIPGEIIVADDPAGLPANLTLATKVLRVANTGDRPIQIGSHFHFYEVNESLSFDRAVAIEILSRNNGSSTRCDKSASV